MIYNPGLHCLSLSYSKKGKGKFLYNTVTSPQDCFKSTLHYTMRQTELLCMFKHNTAPKCRLPWDKWYYSVIISVQSGVKYWLLIIIHISPNTCYSSTTWDEVLITECVSQ